MIFFINLRNSTTLLKTNFMMKRILVLLCALFLVNGNLQSQAVISTPTTMMQDVLHYYYNKFYFKKPTAEPFAFYKSAAATFTGVTHVGSKFEVKDSLLVTG